MTSGSRAAIALWIGLLMAVGCGERRDAGHALRDAGRSAGTLLAPLPAPSPSELLSVDFTHMPLAIGNRWDYRLTFSMRLVYADGSQETSVQSSILRSETTGETILNEQWYFLQSEYDPQQTTSPGPLYAVRADASGLYHLDLFLRDPADAASIAPGLPWARQLEASARAVGARSPHRAALEAAAQRLGARMQAALFATRTSLPGFPGAPGLPPPGQVTGFRHGNPRPGESTMLLYPMFRGTRWIERDTPRFTRSVEGREQLSVPAGSFTAWVVRGRGEFFEPNDRVHFWYAKEGLVCIQGRASTLATDDTGRPIGRLHFELDQRLLSFTRVSYPL